MKAITVPAHVIITALPTAVAINTTLQESSPSAGTSLLYQLLFGKATITTIPVENSTEATPDYFSSYE